MAVARKRRRSNSSRRKPLWQIRLLYYPLLVLIRTITSVICTVRAHGAEEVNGDRQGCIMLANHQSNIDPFVINFALKRQIQYLVSDSNMRSAPARGFFWMVGAIPKTKSMRDINAIRKSLDTVRAGGIVGVFPEGVCSWDGDTVNIIESTAKFNQTAARTGIRCSCTRYLFYTPALVARRAAGRGGHCLSAVIYAAADRRADG